MPKAKEAKRTAYNDLPTMIEAVNHVKALKSRLVLNIEGFTHTDESRYILYRGLLYAYQMDVEVQFICKKNFMLVKPKGVGDD